MYEGLIGMKLGMTQIFSPEGKVMPVTVLKAGPCVVIQKKDKQTDGYEAVQLGLVEATAERKVSKALLGHFKKSKLDPTRRIKEIPAGPDGDSIKVGDQVSADIFKVDDNVDISGISKGKGFAGVIKRHGFGGGRATHGSMFHRAPGSIGASAYPSRVFPGTKLPGRMGGRKITTKNVRVLQVDPENNLLVVKGPVPGADGGYLIISRSKSPKKILKAKQEPEAKKKGARPTPKKK